VRLGLQTEFVAVGLHELRRFRLVTGWILGRRLHETLEPLDQAIPIDVRGDIRPTDGHAARI
jgi:hypothetical protein